MERIDDLEIRGYKIYQDSDDFCFGIDAVLLSNFVLRQIYKNNFYSRQKKYFMCDLCSGSIPIPLIIYAKRKTDINIVAIEQKISQIGLAQKSVDLNKNIDENIKNDILLINDDITNILNEKEKYKKYYDFFDFVSINPPYMKENTALKNDVSNKTLARHEQNLDLDIICKIIYKILKSKKSMFMIHKSNRLSEIIYILKKNRLEPKTLQFIHSYKDRDSKLFLVEAKKDANEEIKILNPIIIYEKENIYTKEVLEIYGK